MAKVSDLQKDLGALKADVEKLRNHTADLVSRVAEVGKDSVDNAVCYSKDTVKKAAKTIENNPVTSIASALGVGVILGGIVKRLFRKKR